ncbi:hypothetical protein CCYA_CCYA18G4504 [Cyanidiococcus yangmingshanensis]|nr:hypothetical protein CCYA_CCYA18G4504 [Cyanidiococcus yangmingshanensis]
MVVCRYYLLGNCKFGDRCRFEHPPGLEGSGARQRSGAASSNAAEPSSARIQRQANSSQDAMVDHTTLSQGAAAGGFMSAPGGSWGVSGPNSFGMVPAGPSTGRVGPATVQGTGRGAGNRKSLWEWWLEGHQAGVWPFSCYGNTYAKNALRGVDVSFEELRADAYAAVQFQGASIEQVEAQEASRVQQALETAQQVLQRQMNRQTARSMQGVSMGSFPTHSLSSTSTPTTATMTAAHTLGQMDPAAFTGAVPTSMMSFGPAMPTPMPDMGLAFPDGRAASSSSPYMQMGAMTASGPSALGASNSDQAVGSFSFPNERAWSETAPASAAEGFANHAFGPATTSSMGEQSFSLVSSPAEATAGSLNGHASMNGPPRDPEHLSESAMNAYRSKTFTKGAVPETPPPSHLC